MPISVGPDNSLMHVRLKEKKIEQTEGVFSFTVIVQVNLW